MTSNMEERVMRVWIAVLIAASVSTGRTIDPRLDGTAREGKIRNWTENIQINIMPSQKAGIEMPTRASTVTAMSVFEYWRVAERTPKGMATTIDRAMAKTASSTVLGKRSKIVPNTGRLET